MVGAVMSRKKWRVQRFMFICPGFQHEHQLQLDTFPVIYHMMLQLVHNMSTSVDYLSVRQGEMRLIICFAQMAMSPSTVDVSQS